MPSGTMAYAFFDTAFGPCGIAWNGTAVTAMHLPEADRSAAEARMARAGAAAGDGGVPAEIARVIADLRRYFDGEEVDFSAVALDLSEASDALRQVYEETRRVGWGHTVTYGEIARRIGSPAAARFVGRAMAMNPVPIIVPCHRVLASGDKLGGFSAFGGTVQKERLLVLERTRLPL
ncbi:MAG: methylated-DNA--[protein]-cysteine S-methyltransferase [Bauldia sp.]|nr:methylated-DNA--[protein]-cysteine S-methyltransferase [Bauldia sp.]